MATLPDSPSPRELSSDARIEASLHRLCDIIAPDWDPTSVERLQCITDAVLDERPATSSDNLEQRLERLCLAAEELGRWADVDQIVARAVALADRHN